MTFSVPKNIYEILPIKSVCEDKVKIREVLQKALVRKGLTLEEVGTLINVNDQELLDEIFAAARLVKEAIYGKRMVLFAPLYISNLCGNECSYCAFRSKNQQVKRRSLTQAEIANEVQVLLDQGQKRVLLVAGESHTQTGLQYILDAIDTVYSINKNKQQGGIRRLNVNIAPLTIEDFKRLCEKPIGTYQLFQETYDPQAYETVHLGGQKKDYAWRLATMDRALQAGIKDIGIGALFGLADWRFEVLALLAHANYLEQTYGVGPHTISVPRLEPAIGSLTSSLPPAPVSDSEFTKIIAILRLAVPYTGIILSTRENPKMRQFALALGVSQLSAGSRTDPGGYGMEASDNAAQFSLGDQRSLEEVICDLIELKYIPSFCTACYRSSRTGHDFMAVAKPGEIHKFCTPNALTTFQEYLIDYASESTRAKGEALIEHEIKSLPESEQKLAHALVDRIRSGKRDEFV